MSVLTDLPVAVAARIKTILPGLKECEAIAGRFNLSRLKATQVRTPAVLVSIVRLRQSGGAAGPVHHFEAAMAAFIVTGDTMGLDRDTAAANIMAAIAAYVPDRRWGQAMCGEAFGVAGQPLISKATEAAATSLWVVEWTQPLVLTASDAIEPLALQLYLGQAPEIGPDHVDDYVEIGGAP